jgi:sugar-specific transcriptional regulator TrmB
MEKNMVYSLQNIGFKESEAEIYLLLLEEPNITGYRISKLLKKTKPSIYKTLELLQKKGLILADQTENAQVFTAVPIQEYFNQKEKELKLKRSEITEALKNIKPGPVKSGLFPLERLDQFITKAIEMIRNAEKVILVACCSISYQEITEEIEAATSRGVKVLIESPSPHPEVQGCEFAYHENSKNSDDFEINWLEIFVDAREYVLSVTSKDGHQLYRSIWCNEQYLSQLTFNSNLGSFILTKVRHLLKQNHSSDEITSIINTMVKTYYQGLEVNKIKKRMEVS